MAQTDIFSKSKEEAEEGKEEEEEEEETSTQSSNDSPKFEGQRFPGRLSLHQRSTTPLEEFERVGRMSQGHTTMNIDVSQAVDVLDVVAQSDASSSSSGESQGAFDKVDVTTIILEGGLMPKRKNIILSTNYYSKLDKHLLNFNEIIELP
jgi:hypothetical protein